MRNLTKEEWEIWWDDPVTVIFRQYLKDYRSKLLELGLNQLLAGPFPLEDQGPWRQQCQLLQELSELDYEDLKRAYEGEDDNSDIATG